MSSGRVSVSVKYYKRQEAVCSCVSSFSMFGKVTVLNMACF